MSATTVDRNPNKLPDILTVSLPVLADAVIPAGVLVATNASGYATNGADTVGLVIQGVSQERVDATDLASGAVNIEVNRLPFLMENSATAALTIAHVGQVCYVEDNQTVGSDPGDAAIVAGRVVKVTTDGVFVDPLAAGVGALGAGLSITAVDGENGTAAVVIQSSHPGVQVVNLWLSAAAYGAPGDPGDLAATTGTILAEHTADALAVAVTDANGTLALTLTRAVDGTTYVNAERNGAATSLAVAVTGN